MQPTDQTQIEPHIAVENMAEFMGYNPLQFIAIQQANGATRNADDCILLAIARSKSIDGVIVDQINRRYRQT